MYGLGVNISTALVVLISYIVGTALYSLALHPLARFPGPLSCAVSRLPFWVACITGKQVEWMHKLHTRYGPVVRYSPNDLSFADEDGTTWKAIHGHGKDEREFPKAKEWFVSPANGTFPFPHAIKPWLTCENRRLWYQQCHHLQGPPPLPSSLCSRLLRPGTQEPGAAIPTSRRLVDLTAPTIGRDNRGCRSGQVVPIYHL